MSHEDSHVLYRKYRPQSFADVVGQDHVVRPLQSALLSGKIAHAYLFSGGRGIGKTTLARLLAKELKTSDKDIYEMDAASNRKIDDFRQLNDSVHTLPFDSKYKVYIIDEVHMLTKEAFNAFLKTLEEPPRHVVFALATTEIDKLPDTIVSRCQTYTLATPSREVIKKLVQSVAKKEGATLDVGATELIALMANGSFRDALGILQKVIVTSADDKLTREEVATVVGAPQSELVLAIVQALAQKNTEDALTAVAQAATHNTDFIVLQQVLLEYVRAVLLLRIAPRTAAFVDEAFGSDDVIALRTIAEQDECGITSKTVRLLIDSIRHTHHAHVPQLPLELAIVDATVQR